MDRDTKEVDMSKFPIKKIPKQQTRLKINSKLKSQLANGQKKEA